MRTPLLDGLKQYDEEQILRFHMPGHYGRMLKEYEELGEKLFCFDVTEVPGLDDLAEPTGILKESLDGIAEVYGAEQSFFLVNGSTSGIHVAIESLVPNGGTLLLARNSHKSILNIARRKNLELEFVYPVLDEVFGVDSHIELEEVRQAVESAGQRVDAAILTYPNYYGRAYDIESIHRYLKEQGIPLIIDSAHGASFVFSKELPCSAVQHSEVCIHSLHKTMPAFTQTSLLHIGSGLNEGQRERIRQNLRIDLSSSPSYLLMASAELAVAIMEDRGEAELERIYHAWQKAVTLLGEQKHIAVYQDEWHPQDFCKLFLKTPIDAEVLSERLRKDHRIQCEMTMGDMILFMLGISHKDEEIEYLARSVIECVTRLIDEGKTIGQRGGSQRNLTFLPRVRRLSSKEIEQMEESLEGEEVSSDGRDCLLSGACCDRSEDIPKRDVAEITVKGWIEAGGIIETVEVQDASGKILAEDIIPYPPGIPILMRYEILDTNSVNLLKYFKIDKIRCFSFKR